MKRSHRILVVDDHRLFREGLRFLLAGLAGEIALDEADSLEALLAIKAPGGVDLVLLDYHLPDVTGLEALAAARERFPAAAIVVVSGEEDVATIRAVIRNGACGFIPKSSSSQILIAALRLVIAGGFYLPPQLLAGEEEGEPMREKLVRNLSTRQHEVLLGAVQGKANKVIARELNISEHTVKVHLSAALKALGAKNRTEAVYAAAKLGIK